MTLPDPPETKAPPAPGARWFHGLSFRLFAITIISILIVEALIFIPSASKERTDWLNERLSAARIAALSLEAAPSRMVSEELSEELLKNAQVYAVTEIMDDTRVQLLPPAQPVEGTPYIVDMRSGAMQRSLSAIGAFFAPDDRILIVYDEGSAPGRIIEVVMPHAPLKQRIQSFGWRIVGLSLLIALIAASLIYLLLHWLVVRAMQRVTTSVERFSEDPGGWTRRLEPTRRRDEIGRAQNALLAMENAVADSFRQQSRLADLGEAVAKINHDLRNSLTSAQLVSDSLSRSEDPRVQRAAPRLERALERAIKLATETLEFGKAKPQAALLETLDLHAAIEEATLEGLARQSDVTCVNTVPANTHVTADADHLHRILSNLIRNAAEAITDTGQTEMTITVAYTDGAILIADTGPGLPDRVSENLFKPFAYSTKKSGTGLGLAIARELARSMGGDVILQQSGPGGTTFRITLPPART